MLNCKYSVILDNVADLSESSTQLPREAWTPSDYGPSVPKSSPQESCSGWPTGTTASLATELLPNCT